VAQPTSLESIFLFWIACAATLILCLAAFGLLLGPLRVSSHLRPWWTAYTLTTPLLIMLLPLVLVWFLLVYGLAKLLGPDVAVILGAMVTLVVLPLFAYRRALSHTRLPGIGARSAVIAGASFASVSVALYLFHAAYA
jgi:hypothetical protein